jgi:hypothetical protein
MLRGFSWEPGYAVYLFGRSLRVLLGFGRVRGFACAPYTYAFQRPIPSGRAAVTPPSPHRSWRWHWNIDQLSIGYALRLFLRPRLTRG